MYVVCGGVDGGGGSAPPYGALWPRCRALRPTHSAGRPTEGPRPTPWSRILDQQIRQRGACVVSHSQRVLHILNGPTLLHAAASCCVDSTYHQVRSSPACLLSPDRRTRILRRAAHQISSPFTCTSCPHACDAASCMPRATSWLCLPPSDPVTMPSCCRFITRMSIGPALFPPYIALQKF